MTEGLIEQAKEYARTNEELRRLLGVTPDLPIVLKPLGKGEHNVNFAIYVGDVDGDPSCILRVNVVPQPFHDCQVCYEFDALKAVFPSGVTPEPIYLDASGKAPAHGILVESFCPGRQLDFDDLLTGDLDRCARIMASIHSVSVVSPCKLFRPHDPLMGLYDECMERLEFYKNSGFEDARISVWADKLSNLALDSIQEAGSPHDAAHIVNTEPLASHFLLPDGEGEGWFVDWERPIIGEVVQDLSFFLAPTTTFWDSDFLMPRSCIDRFLDTYWQAVDGRFDRGGFESRFDAWLRCSVLRAFAWCCKALPKFKTGEGYMTEKAKEKLPIYLSDEFLDKMLRECF